jgi:hypothetical protein
MSKARGFFNQQEGNSMTDTNKLEIEKEALIFYADRLKMQVFEKQFEIDKALEQSNGYLDIIRELNIKIDQLEKDLLSLHKTLESTESELAKVRNGGVKF